MGILYAGTCDDGGRRRAPADGGRSVLIWRLASMAAGVNVYFIFLREVFIRRRWRCWNFGAEGCAHLGAGRIATALRTKRAGAPRPQTRQSRLSRHHESRASHAPQRHHGLLEVMKGEVLGPIAIRCTANTAEIFTTASAICSIDQRDPRSVAHRSGRYELHEEPLRIARHRRGLRAAFETARAIQERRTRRGLRSDAAAGLG